MNKKRDALLDVIKGISIILVVLGHTNFVWNHYIYLFHVAVFFMLSGVLYDENKIKNGHDIKNYIIKRIKRLYVPYVVINIVAIILNNFFINIHVYNINTHSYFGIKEMIMEIIKTLLFCGNSEIIGATWFLRILFFIGIIYCLFEKMARKCKYKEIYHLIFSIVLFFVGLGINKINIKLSLFQPIFTCYILYVIGNRYIKYINEYINKLDKKCEICLLVVSVTLLIIMGNFGEIEISKAIYTNLYFFITVSIIGWIITYIVSKIVLKYMYVKDIITYIGKNSIFILFLHFIAFKIETYIIILIYKLDINKLGEFPVISTDNKMNSFIYLVGGLIIPLLISYIYNKIKERRKYSEIRGSDCNI